ncbi:Prenyltransferase/squalene oxidase [Planctomycetales bacterium 10988]|nr:Prenyltransferase/squalene oxidase [Planctomycetales bacterium 10988]
MSFLYGPRWEKVAMMKKAKGSFSPRPLLVLLFGCCSFLFAPVQKSAYGQGFDLKPEQVRRAIDRGVDYLVRRQEDDGTWIHYGDYEHGQAALTVLALLQAGMSPEDGPVQKTLSYLRTKGRSEKTYTVALETMAFTAARSLPDIGIIRRNAKWLEQNQNDNGTWSYGPEISHSNRTGDHSNTQFALLGLYEAERFSQSIQEDNNASIRIDSRTWQNSLDHFLSTQNIDGSWGYTSADRAASASMTCAGISSVIICSTKLRDSESKLDNQGELPCCGAMPENRADESIDRGLQWLAKNFSVDSNIGASGSWLFYYLYGLERVGRLSSQRFIGNHDWYREGTAKLVQAQDGLNGFWQGVGLVENQYPDIATSLALLFLTKGRRPLLLAKVVHGPARDWNHHPDDAAHLTRYVENQWEVDLTWQLIDLEDATVEDLRQIPVLYISGQRAPNFSDQSLTKIKEYLQEGGFVFAEACCNGKRSGFDQGFRQMVRKMFPDHPQGLVPLLEEHPIWRVEEIVPPEAVGSLHGMNVSCRTSIIYSDEDISCRWQFGMPPFVRNLKRLDADLYQEVRTAQSIGINVLAYATNRELKYKFEYFNDRELDLPRNILSRNQLYLAQVLHSGGSEAAPQALPNLKRQLVQTGRLDVHFQPAELPLADPKIFDYPVLFMHGRNAFTLSQADRDNLKEYVNRGGVVLADSICGNKAFADSFRQAMKETFPEIPLERIPTEHPLFTSQFGGFDLKTIRRREAQRAGENQPLRVFERKTEPLLEGIAIGERYAVLFSPYDMSCAMENNASIDCEGYITEDALRIGVNAVLYSLNQPGP